MADIDYSKLSDEELERIAGGKDQAPASAEQDMGQLSDAQLEQIASGKPAETMPQISPVVGGIGATATLGTPLAGALGAAGGASILGEMWDKNKPGTPAGNQVMQSVRDVVRPAPQQAAAPTPSPAEKWNVAMHGTELPNAQMDKASFERGQNMQRAIGPGGELAGGTIRGGVIVGPQASAALQQKEAQVSAQQRDAEMLQEARQRMHQNKEVARRRAEGYDVKVEKPVKKPEGLGSKVIKKSINAGMAYPATFGMGYNATDVMNRINQGDYGQALLSGAGTAGAAATMVPKGRARGIGAAMAVGAPVVNALIDSVKGEPKSVMNKANGGIISPHIEHMAKGGAVDRHKLKSGLGMLPMAQRTDMRQMGQQMDQGGGSALAYELTKQGYNHPVTQGTMLGGSFLNPYLAAGMMGKDLINDVSGGDYGSAAMNAGLNAMPFAKQGMQAMRKVPGAIRGMMGGAERSVMPGMVPAFAGGGNVIKELARKVMGSADEVGSRTIAGSPHSYPPIAEGPWMRDYQPAARPAPQIEYMGKYLSPTPERMAAQKAQMNADIQGAIENRKAQWIKRSKEMGLSDQEILEQMNSPWGAPWMP